MADCVIKEIAIERIKRVKPHVVMSEYGVGYERGLKDAIGILNATPAAPVQPVKHGRWIEQRHTPTNGYNYNVPYSTYVCSSCGLEIHNDEYSKYVRGTYTNCPVCTARMDGGADDENS